ncbi:hypothetical protein FKW77_008868 [Venturia effusa]|uniref:beta-glucosidase n=1 Tax=Venturia effusa TaxID=50376 RepID=A0A517L007_9PEZI|nr:hypothetical protein FKW77_008868 [Venturia effusa]
MIATFLAGALGAEAVLGLQNSVLACVKHLVGNEQETDRTTSLFKPGKEAVSSNIDDRTMHELYLWPFQDAVKAGAASVMCSYQKINGSYGCQNSKVLNGLLKTELGFQGFVVSDWDGQHAGVASAAAGLDMVMPSPALWADHALEKAVQNGSLPQSRLDDMATRVLASWFKAGMDSPSYPALGIGLPAAILDPHQLVDGRDPTSKRSLLQGAIEGHVLVKNVNKTLPLKSPKLLSLFGYDAYAPLVVNPSSLFVNKWTYGLASVAANDSQLLSILAGIASGTIGTATQGTLTKGGGSGSAYGPYISAPYNAFEQQAYEDGTHLFWDFQNENPAVAAASNACIVFINEFATEILDRPSLADTASDKLVKNVASKCSNTIVVIHNAGIRLVDAWIDNVNVTAVIFAHTPGQDSGRALVEVMYGKQAFSGRLPYTVGRSERDYGNLLSPSQPGPKGSDTFLYPQSDFTEGLNIGYRDFIARNITPRYPFGYGLTYTTFSYSALSITPMTSDLAYPLPPAPSKQGGNPNLFTTIAHINCSITNTGSVTAAEVAQLYIGIPNSPPKQLRGFEKKLLNPEESAPFSFALTRRDLSIWSTEEQEWVLQRGKYPIYVGASVLDIKLQGVLTI